MPGSEDKMGSSEKKTAGDKSNSLLPTISLPKGGGAIRGIGEKFAANPVTGTGSMTVPIATSPGRSGFGPQLSLAYDSGAGNGPFGFGWSLSLPSITRKTDKGLPKYQDADESDVFILSGAEDLVPAFKPNTTQIDEAERDGYRVRRYRPRIEGLFARIERWARLSDGDVHWRSISKDNITTLYGKTAGTRIADPADQSRVFSWLICESYDDKGNAIAYKYKEENLDGVKLSQAHEANRTRSANRYLKRIKYCNKTPRQPNEDLSLRTDWLFEVVFDYGEHYLENDQGQPTFIEFSDNQRPWLIRQDPFSIYRSGFEVRTYRLCRRILMFHHFPNELGTPNYLVHATLFDYRESPIASFIASVTQAGYANTNGTYLKKAMPPVEFTYTDATIDETVRDVDRESLDNLPYGLDGVHYQWVDLDGEGISGILTEQADGWFYKRNLSPITVKKENGQEITVAGFAPVEVVASKPSLANLSGGRQQLLDLAGDGQLDLAEFSGAAPGFFERTEEGSWELFTAFQSLPRLDWGDPNLRFVDLTGDGHADVLITEDAVLCWYPSLAEDGFGPGERTSQPFDEEKGPRLVFADGTQSIYLADLSGDGLTDLVRVRNGEVCYWPNIGYGRFGAKVTMDNAPWFDAPDLFDQRRIRLADIDGSGTTDLIYLGQNQIDIYRNQAGNSWSDGERLTSFPPIDNLSSVQAMDLLGNGTACLVWSSPLSGDARRPMRYIDLMGGQKPHLLIKTVNNLGAETVVDYAPSTKFYLQDKLAGTPWITRLPFPVHVVERVETYDRISRNRFVTSYAYHHGYFDGIEREFRGFGMVEQWDTEEFAALSASDDFPVGENIDEASHVPPVLTMTWFHTGAFFDRNHISNFFAGLIDDNDVGEYYREPGLSDAQARQLLLDDTVLPDGLSAEEEREACRSLKGSILRQEVYALDKSPKAAHPYTVSERNYTIEQRQPRGSNQHAVFFTHSRETIDYHYERNHADPRVSHSLVLEVDKYGNMLKSIAVGYGRRPNLSPLQGDDKKKQEQLLITYSENDITNAVDELDNYRVPLPCEARTYEFTGFKLVAGSQRFPFGAFVDESAATMADRFPAIRDAEEIVYEETADLTKKQKRVIERLRTLYRKNDLTGPLPLGQLQSLALPSEGYKLAFTPSLVTTLYETRVTDVMLTEGGYVHSEGDNNWWISSGHSELPADANAHFFLPSGFTDPFGQTTTVQYDGHDLLLAKTTDPLGNTVSAENDYRVLQPRLVTDPNGNRSAAAFDAMGMVVGVAVMGKPGENKGDLLDDTFDSNLDDATALEHLANPLNDPYAILQKATTRLVYDLFAYPRTKSDPQPQPAVVYTLVRETHHFDLAVNEKTKVQHSFSYSDGFGREIQKKIQAEPGPLVEGGPTVNPRWVGSGWTIFNNKGKPVRQYEPFFSQLAEKRHRFEFGVKVGVSPILFYDPVERVVATLHPNHTYEKVVFDPWQQTTYDMNDTVAANGTETGDPRTDADIKGYVAEYFKAQPNIWQTWHQERITGAKGAQEKSAAERAAKHANTPTIAHFDTLSRPFLTLAHNGFKPDGTSIQFPTRVKLDIEGNQREVRDAILQNGDALGRIVMHYDYDILSNRIHQASMEAGERWMLNDVTGKPIRAWDSREHTIETRYDELRRPVEMYVSGGDDIPAGARMFAETTVYGESQGSAKNHRGKVYQHYDGAGVFTNVEYDFKGNLKETSRKLVQEYKKQIDWNQPPADDETFTTTTQFDVLNRVVLLITPHSATIIPSEVRPIYNEANLLNEVRAKVRGGVETAYVKNIDYDAKGQREQIEYGNGVSTKYEYDKDTFRLIHLKTSRNSDSATLQDLSYTYDPVGNITFIADGAQQPIYFNNAVIEPQADYTYDAIYRLLMANGREHIGQAAQPESTWDDKFRVGLPLPTDGQAMRNYAESYQYDAVGNILAMIHTANNGNWTRSYAYNEASLIEPSKKSNRLTSTTIGAITETYGYVPPDGHHGNTTSMPHLSQMTWDFKDELSQVDLGGGGTAYYVYDAAGQRVRKVIERQSGAITKEERIYLGGYEIFRQYDNSGLKLERETLHVMDDKQRIALVETRTQGNDGSPTQLIRYQFTNHLGSVLLELNDQAIPITYEEYYPYGSTSYQAVNSALRAAAKRYRYTGKERDEETGLYYHGARYYAAWLARWLSPDKTGIGDGLNRYVYVHDRPIAMSDPTGNYGEGGHYYTVYFASLAAGFDPKTAQRNAAFAQMPDEVKALDAIEQQESRLAAPGGMVSWTQSERDLVQRGLHSLTGGFSATERQMTRDAIARTKPGTMEFGFLLHRFGDTYAHSVKGNEARMYDTGFGHFFDFHAPDQIHERPDLYQSYVKDLYGTLSAAARTQGRVSRLSQGQVAKFAEEVGNIRVMTPRIRADSGVVIVVQELDVAATEREQIKRIRELSEKYMGKTEFEESGAFGPPTIAQTEKVGHMSFYTPETPNVEDTMPWAEYKAKHPEFVGQYHWSDVQEAVHSAASKVGEDRTFYPLRPQ